MGSGASSQKVRRRADSIATFEFEDDRGEENMVEQEEKGNHSKPMPPPERLPPPAQQAQSGGSRRSSKGRKSDSNASKTSKRGSEATQKRAIRAESSRSQAAAASAVPQHAASSLQMDEPVEPNTLLKSPLPAILALSDSDTSSEDDDSTDSSVCESVAAPLPPIEALDDGLQHSQRDEDVGPSLPPLQQQVTQRDDVVPLSVDTQPFLPRSAKPSEPDLELLLSPTESFTPSRGGSPKPVRLKSNFGPSALAQFVLSVPWAAALALPVAEEESVVEQINTAISEEEVARLATLVEEERAKAWLWILSTPFPEACVYACMEPGTMPKGAAHIPKLLRALSGIIAFLPLKDILAFNSVSGTLCRDTNHFVTAIFCKDIIGSVCLRACARFSALHTLALSFLRPDPFSVIIPSLYKTACLRSLSLRRNGMDRVRLDEFTLNWNYRCQLTSLDLSDNPLGDDSVNSLSKCVLGFTRLHCLRLAKIGLSDYGAERLSNLFRHPTVCRSLDELDLHGNDILAGGCSALAADIIACTRLRSLNVNSCLIGVLGSLPLSSSLLPCTNLQELRLAGNRLSSRGIGVFSQSFPLYQELRLLDISHNGIDGRAVVDGLAAALPLCHRLSSLNVSSNPIGDEGVIALASCFKQCRLLVHLDVGDTRAGHAGVLAILSALPSMPRLEGLSLQNNSAGPSAGKEMGNQMLLGHCHRLTSLDMSGNALEASGFIELASGFSGKHAIRSLSIGGNGIDSSVVGMVEALQATISAGGRSLRSLDVSQNRLGEKGILALTSRLSLDCPLISVLNISGTNLGSKVAARLAAYLQRLNCLEVLNVRSNHLGEATVKDLSGALPRLRRLLCDYPILERGLVAE